MDEENKHNPNLLNHMYYAPDEFKRMARHIMEEMRQENPRATKEDLEDCEERVYRVLGFTGPDDPAIIDFRKNQEWVKEHRELTAHMKKHSITLIITAFLGVVATGVVLWIKSLTVK